MENFILWGISESGVEHAVSFYATSVNIQQIQAGTDELVQHMLHDIGVDGAPVQWSLKAHFMTNYLTEDRSSPDWEDSWSETWEFRVRLDRSSPLPPETELFRTSHWDDSWDGEPVQFPIEAAIFGEFEDTSSLSRANELIRRTAKGTSHEIEPGVQAAAVTVQRELAGLSVATTPQIHAEVRGGLLRVSLGSHDKEFFAEGAKLARAVADLIKATGGTTTWDERYA